MLIFIRTNHTALLSFRLSPTETGASDGVMSWPGMNKSWQVSVTLREPHIKPQNTENKNFKYHWQNSSLNTDRQNPQPAFYFHKFLLPWFFLFYFILNFSLFYIFYLLYGCHNLWSQLFLTKCFLCSDFMNGIISVWKKRLARQEQRLKLSTDPSPRHNSAANVNRELVFMLFWISVGAFWSQTSKAHCKNEWLFTQIPSLFARGSFWAPSLLLLHGSEFRIEFVVWEQIGEDLLWMKMSFQFE